MERFMLESAGVRVHLAESNHLPVDSVDGVRDRLMELERSGRHLEAQVQS